MGLVLRMLCEFAYYPAVHFPDTAAYLRAGAHLTPPLWHPIGYSLLVDLVGRSTPLITGVQHLVGIAMALLLVVLLEHTGLSRRMSALAVVPILLDPMQIYLEQFVLSDVVFTFLVVCAIVLSFRARLTERTAAAVGLLIALATLVRTLALLLAVPLAAVWVWRRVGWRRIAAGAAFVAVPLLAYAGLFEAANGSFALQGYTGRWLYGRVAPIAECSRLHLSPPQRVWCPAFSPEQRVGPSQFVWDPTLNFYGPGLPTYALRRSQSAGVFARDVILHQPTRYAGAVLHDVGTAFAPGRNTDARQWFVGSWLFYQQDFPPYWRVRVPGYSGSSSRQAVGRFLAAYQRYIYVSGPVLLLACVVAVGGLVFGLRRGKAVLAVLLSIGLLFLVVPMLTVGFDFRYVLPAIEMLVPAAFVGAHLLWVRLRKRVRSPRWADPRLAGAVVGVVMVGAVLGNLGTPVGYASSAFRLPRPQPLGQETVGGSLLLSVSRPEVVGVQCQQAVETHHRHFRGQTAWVLASPVQAQLLRGSQRLLTMDNFYAVNVMLGHRRVIESRPFVPLQGQLTSRVLTPSYPDGTGAVEYVAPEARGELGYIDPLGHGTAAWRYVVPSDPSVAAPGSRCRSPGTYRLTPGGGLVRVEPRFYGDQRPTRVPAA
ncbi:MAG TPA: hypothetical protein VFH66_04760 [Mycobacteriales bacterium]|nr:hypothetical protein [Mycobacteriales bacterium]